MVDDRHNKQTNYNATLIHCLRSEETIIVGACEDNP